MDLDEYMMYLAANYHVLYSIHIPDLDEYQIKTLTHFPNSRIEKNEKKLMPPSPSRI
jgi:hypothetical protein